MTGVARLIDTNVLPSVKAKYEELVAAFPDITHVYGGNSAPDHNNRRCLDLMVVDLSGKFIEPRGMKNLSWTEQRALGNRIVAYLKANAVRLGVNGLVWNEQGGPNARVMGFPHATPAPYRGPTGVWRKYDPDPRTNNDERSHSDHVHVEFDSSPYKPPAGTKPLAGTVWVDLLVPGVTNSTSVRLFQRALGLPETGTFGSVEREAARAFQASLGDTVKDGLLGPLQARALFDKAGLNVTLRLDPSGQAPKPPKPPAVTHEITAVEANVLRRTDPDDSRKEWPQRVANIVKAILSAKPDLVLLNEVDSFTAADIASRLGSVWRYQRLKGVAVAWRSDVFDFTEGRNVEHLFSTKDNRYYFGVPLTHKASGETIWADTSHLENDGDAKTDGEAVRRIQATEIAARTKSGKRIFGADLNSTTLSTGANGVKPRVILGKAGWSFLTNQKGVANREYASHHGGKGSTPKGPWIDDLGFRGVTYVRGGLIRTDGTDASDHHFLTITVKF